MKKTIYYPPPKTLLCFSLYTPYYFVVLLTKMVRVNTNRIENLFRFELKNWKIRLLFHKIIIQ